MKKILVVLLALAVTFSVAAGSNRDSSPSSGSASGSAARTSRDTVIWGENIAAQGVFHPTVNTSDADRRVVLLVFNRLVATDPSGNYIPELAESWTVSPDATNVTFRLRRDVKWTDGQSFTADDVAFTYETLAHARFVRGNDEFSKKLLGFADYNAGRTAHVAGVRVIDTYTVSFTFDGPYRDAMVKFIDQGVFAKHIWEKVPVEGWLDATELLRNPVGTGPYKVTQYVPDQYTRLVANDSYFNGAPVIKNFILQVSNPNTRPLELRNGDLDIARVANWTDRELKPYNDAGIGIAEVKAIMVYYLVFNTTDRNFSDPILRQAIFASLDRTAIIRAIENGHAVTSETLLQPTQKVYPQDIEKYTYDVNKAKSLLAQAGWRDTNNDGIVDKNGQNLRITLRYDNVDDTDLAVLVQSYIKAVGVDIEIIGSDFNTVLSTLRSTTDPFELAFMGATYRPNPGNGGGHRWMARYNDPEELRLFEIANGSGTDAEALAAWGAWGKYVHQQLPIGVLYFKSTGYAFNPKLVGFEPTATEYFPNVEKWYFK
ncbi:ABC transporter substrate-binding protein [Spirochaetia bacterium]|nr:ABC transporter substrate-binding protein [Spirochaetia bacterium]